MSYRRQHSFIGIWLLATGMISLLVGTVILASWPTSMSWAIGLLVGVELVASGAEPSMSAALVDAFDPRAPGHRAVR